MLNTKPPTAQQIAALRAKAGLTQVEFGEIAGATKKAVQAWEYGARNMPIVTWLYLRHVLGIKEIQFGVCAPQ